MTTSADTTPALCMPITVNEDEIVNVNEDEIVNVTNDTPGTNASQDDDTKNPEDKIAATATTTVATSRKRLCRFPGCERVIKSQGHCQRHGARAKRCRYPGGCEKQAQGTHEGMCKRHWRIVQNQNKSPDEIIPPNSNKIRLSAPPPPSGTSVYEFIIPNSIAYRPTPQQIFSVLAVPPSTGKAVETIVPTPDHHATAALPTAEMNDDPSPSTAMFEPIVPPQYDPHNHTTMSTSNNHNAKGQQIVMPLVHYLAANMNLPAGWHRIHERRTRGVYPITSITTQLEGWERQLAFLEICLLSGGTPQANFKHFCHAWGRDATFVSRLSNFICERRGESDRKKMRSSDGTAAVDKKPLKKTGVIIPRTTPLEIYRSGIAEVATQSEIVEHTETSSTTMEQTVEATAVDEIEIDPPIHNSDDNNNHGIDSMMGHESESFLMDESIEDTNQHGRTEMAMV